MRDNVPEDLLPFFYVFKKTKIMLVLGLGIRDSTKLSFYYFFFQGMRRAGAAGIENYSYRTFEYLSVQPGETFKTELVIRK